MRGAPPPPVIKPPNAAADNQFVCAQLWLVVTGNVRNLPFDLDLWLFKLESVQRSAHAWGIAVGGFKERRFAGHTLAAAAAAAARRRDLTA